MTEVKDIQNDWDEAKRDINKFLEDTIIPCLDGPQKRAFKNTMNKIFKEINEDIENAFIKGLKSKHEELLIKLRETGRFSEDELNSL